MMKEKINTEKANYSIILKKNDSIIVLLFNDFIEYEDILEDIVVSTVEDGRSDNIIYSGKC